MCLLHDGRLAGIHGRHQTVPEIPKHKRVAVLVNCCHALKRLPGRPREVLYIPTERINSIAPKLAAKN